MNRIGVKNFLKLFKNPVDWDKIAKKTAKERGVSVAEIKKNGMKLLKKEL